LGTAIEERAHQPFQVSGRMAPRGALAGVCHPPVRGHHFSPCLAAVWPQPLRDGNQRKSRARRPLLRG
jgi:hypothetical protein